MTEREEPENEKAKPKPDERTQGTTYVFEDLKGGGQRITRIYPDGSRFTTRKDTLGGPEIPEEPSPFGGM